MGATQTDAPRNLADIIGDAAGAAAGSPALIGSFGQRTWGELGAAVRSGARALADLPPGTPVLVALPVGPELAAALFAVFGAGLVAVPVDPERTDIGATMGRLGLSTVICDDAVSAPRVISAAEVAGWWAIDAPRHDGAPAPLRGGGEDIALLARAGRPHPPVMLSHRALLAAGRAIAAAPPVALTGSDRVLQVLPLFHVVGLVTAFIPTALAGAAVVIPDDADPATRVESALAAVRAHRVSFLPAEPTLYRQVERVPGFERALSTVRLMTSGSSSLDPVDFATIRSATGLAVREGYGISEAASAITSTLMASAARPGSSGRPYPGVELRIVNHLADDTAAGTDDADSAGDPAGGDAEPGDAPAPTSAGRAFIEGVADLVDGVNDLVDTADPGGGLGLIAIRGATLFSGYWPDGSDGPDADGWFLTGDIGYLDDAGELRLVDRVSETMTVDGFTVYPREIEDVIARHPMVADVAVVGLPRRGGETVVAAIVPKPGTRPTAEDVGEHVAALLPLFKRPTDYRLVDVLPRTEVGRLDRGAVRREFAEARGIDLSPNPLRAAGSGKAAPPRRRRVGGATRSSAARAAADTDEDLF